MKMKVFTFILAFMMVSLTTFAQSFDYYVTDNDTIKGGAIGDWIEFSGHVVNNSTKSITTSWTVVKNFPDTTWSTFVCDGVQCYGTDVSTQQQPTAAGASSLMKPTIIPGSLGTGSITITVEDILTNEKQSIIQTENLANKADTDVKLNWENAASTTQADRREIHLLLQSAKNDYKRLQLNTVASTCMKLLNHLQTLTPKLNSEDSLYYQTLINKGASILLSILNPITPHITQALWNMLKFEGEITDTPSPKVNKSALLRNEIELVVQINGKLRTQITVSASADKATIESIALADEKTQQYTNGKVIRKVIVVPNRLVNIVVGEK